MSQCFGCLTDFGASSTGNTYYLLYSVYRYFYSRGSGKIPLEEQENIHATTGNSFYRYHNVSVKGDNVSNTCFSHGQYSYPRSLRDGKCLLVL